MSQPPASEGEAPIVVPVSPSTAPGALAAAEAVETAVRVVVLRTRSEVQTLPADAVRAVVATPRLSAVPGAIPPLVGVAVVEGEPVPVVALDDPGDVLVLCTHRGVRLGLVGARVVLAEHAPDGATPLDLDLLFADLRVPPPSWLFPRGDPSGNFGAPEVSSRL